MTYWSGYFVLYCCTDRYVVLTISEGNMQKEKCLQLLDSLLLQTLKIQL